MQEKNDIREVIADTHFDVRVAGVLIVGGNILVSNERTGEQTLYGGAVKIGETTEAAIIREFKEETNLNVLPKRLCAVIENFFSFSDGPHHQFIFVYELGLTDSKQIVRTPATERLKSDWTNLNKITQLRPKILNELVGKIASGQLENIVHLINEDN